MTDRPILFSGPMVRALLDGRKTQTRRVIKPQPPADVVRHCWYDAPIYGFTKDRDVTADWHKTRLLAYKGDRLWVREKYLPDPPSDDPSWNDNVCTFVEWSGCGSKVTDVPPALREAAYAIYAADEKWAGYEMQWRPSIHMPRWASRLTLIVEDVRVERLQDISEADAIAEGAQRDSDGWQDYQMPHTQCCATAKASYQTLWDSINGPGAWTANPWVAAYTFRVIKANIDSPEASHE